MEGAVFEKTPADAAEMLSEMSEDNYKALMTIIIHVYNDDVVAQKRRQEIISRKRRAFLRMEELRKNASQYYGRDFDADQERAKGLEEKYGRIDQVPFIYH